MVTLRPLSATLTRSDAKFQRSQSQHRPTSALVRPSLANVSGQSSLAIKRQRPQSASLAGTAAAGAANAKAVAVDESKRLIRDIFELCCEQLHVDPELLEALHRNLQNLMLTDPTPFQRILEVLSQHRRTTIQVLKRIESRERVVLCAAAFLDETIHVDLLAQRASDLISAAIEGSSQADDQKETGKGGSPSFARHASQSSNASSSHYGFPFRQLETVARAIPEILDESIATLPAAVLSATAAEGDAIVQSLEQCTDAVQLALTEWRTSYSAIWKEIDRSPSAGGSLMESLTAPPCGSAHVVVNHVTPFLWHGNDYATKMSAEMACLRSLKDRWSLSYISKVLDERERRLKRERLHADDGALRRHKEELAAKARNEFLNVAASRIQAAYRGHRCAMWFGLVMLQRRAIRRIIRWWRGMKTRQQFVAATDHTNAAVTLQRLWRGYVARRQFPLNMKRHRAARRIQRWWRFWDCHFRMVVRKLQRAHHIQALAIVARTVGRYIARRRRAKESAMRNAALLLQRWSRGRLTARLQLESARRCAQALKLKAIVPHGTDLCRWQEHPHTPERDIDRSEEDECLASPVTVVPSETTIVDSCDPLRCEAPKSTSHVNIVSSPTLNTTRAHDAAATGSGEVQECRHAAKLAPSPVSMPAQHATLPQATEDLQRIFPEHLQSGSVAWFGSQQPRREQHQPPLVSLASESAKVVVRNEKGSAGVNEAIMLDRRRRALLIVQRCGQRYLASLRCAQQWLANRAEKARRLAEMERQRNAARVIQSFCQTRLSVLYRRHLHVLQAVTPSPETTAARRIQRWWKRIAAEMANRRVTTLDIEDEALLNFCPALVKAKQVVAPSVDMSRRERLAPSSGTSGVVAMKPQSLASSQPYGTVNTRAVVPHVVAPRQVATPSLTPSRMATASGTIRVVPLIPTSTRAYTLQEARLRKQAAMRIAKWALHILQHVRRRDARQHAAACTISRAFRCYKLQRSYFVQRKLRAAEEARREAERRERERLQETAARTQAARVIWYTYQRWRCETLLRRLDAGYDAIRNQPDRDRNATTIQRFWRAARDRVERLRTMQRQNETFEAKRAAEKTIAAAVAIQSRFRAFLHRDELEQRRYLLRQSREAAVVVIQKYVRRWLAKNVFWQQKISKLSMFRELQKLRQQQKLRQAKFDAENRIPMINSGASAPSRSDANPVHLMPGPMRRHAW